MCVNLPPRDLNPSSYTPHPTNIYTCGVTTAPRVRGGGNFLDVLIAHHDIPDLNPSSYTLHPTNIYTCGVAITPRLHGGGNFLNVLIAHHDVPGFI